MEEKNTWEGEDDATYYVDGIVRVRVIIETMLVEDGAVYADDSSMFPVIFYRVKYVIVFS